MAKLLMLFAGGFIVWYSVRWYKQQDPAVARKSLLTYVLWGGVAVLILMALTGRTHWITAAVGALIPVLKSGFPYLRRLIPFAWQWQKGRAEQQGRLKGEWLQLSVNPLQGRVDGVVLKGELENKKLSELVESELKSLLASCLQSDTKSTQLLAVFLQQTYGEQWQSAFSDVLNNHREQRFDAPHSPGEMSIKEASEILGVTETASKQEINQAYKSLMQKVHPDRGGSDYLTRLVAQAKEVMLSKKA
ncbi:DnaJ domain-containing protein [Litoribacillus peritrichatus]|uniref:J domain-containing protein n=1 Tax=Litoribacillus peritrichatus TaxID=718191 RepID=A0ABP7N9I4_9GAMM